jgi:hypothetical protein
MSLSAKARNILWWVGVPVATALLSVLPYWAWNILGGVSPWWRVTAVTPGLFDTYVYLNWLGGAAEQLPYGGHLKWLGDVLGFVWPLLRSWMSIPELWIVSRWVTFTLTIWIGAWAIGHWSGLPRFQSRLFSVAFFSALIVTLGMRPGVYAWYLPFCIAGITCALFASRALTQHAWVKAAVWSLASFGLCWLYPWFFLVAAIWLATAWMIHLSRLRAWILPVVFILGATLGVATGVPLARWFLDPAQAPLIGIYERNGMALSHAPFFANTVLAMGAWIAMLAVLTRRAAQPDDRKRFMFLGAGWIGLLVLWFHTPFMGLFMYSDHFIGPVTLFAWISLAVVWSAIRRAETFRPEASRFFQVIPWLIAGGSILFFLYILQQPLRFNLKKFDSYIVHLTHWAALAIASSIALWRMRHPFYTAQVDSILSRSLIGLAVALGVAGTLPMFLRDLPHVPEVAARIPLIQWIRMETNPDEKLCADPESASFYAAHTGRHIYPAEATLSWWRSSEDIIQDLETLVRSYDVRAAGEEEMFRFYTDHYRTVSCASEGRYSHGSFVASLISPLGWDEARVNEWLGCNMQTITAHRVRVEAAMNARTPDPVAFRALCPAIIVPAEQKAFWSIPSDYVEHRVLSDLSVWRAP